MSFILDVTIFYPTGVPDFWDFLCGRVKRIDVHVKKYPVTEDLLGDYSRDEQYRTRFQSWLNDRWEAKEKWLQQANSQSATEK